MANWALYVFLFILTLLCGVLGFGMHYWRANFSIYPENLTDNSLLDGLMSNHDMVFEKHIIEAKWDDNGYWDLYSLRNMIYYVVSGAAAPLLLAIFDWNVIKVLGDAFCSFMVAHGNHSLLCY
jgi:hypothetical protein